MQTFQTYLFVKSATSLFNPHQRQAMQIGRMFERTKGKSQASQGILNSASNKGPISMNEIALKKEQETFQKDQKKFDKDRQSFEEQQKEVQRLKEDLEHQQTLHKRQLELEKVEKNRPEPKQPDQDAFTASLNAHAKGTVKKFRSTLDRLLTR